MSKYSKYGGLDDVRKGDRELGFIGFNNRLRPDQIQSGLLQKSENGRLDLNGQWQSRKGVQNRLSPFAVSGTALRLPTSDEITAGTIMLLSHTITAATASSGTITLTTAQAHNLSVGDTIEVNDIVSNGDDVNGSQTLIAGTTGSTLKYTVGSSSPTLTVTEGANLGITTTTGPQFSPLDFTTGTPPKFLPCAGAVILDDTAVSEVTCGCKFSDPNVTTDEEFILLASNAKVVAFNTSTLASFDIPLQTGETIPGNSTILQVFNKVIIFRDSQISLENDKFFSPFTISAASSSSTTRTITTFGDHGLQTGDSVDISGITATETYIGQYEITKTGDKTFTYTASGSGSSTTTLSDAKVSPTFLLVPNGSFTQRLELDITDLDYADGIATATVSSTSSLKNGTDLKVVTVESSGFTVGDIVTVSEVLTSTTFTFITDKADDTNKSMHVTLPISEGLGFTHSPAPNFGAYHNKRLVVPYNYEVTGTSGSSTITDRNIKDEVLISDLLDSDTFDQIFAQFRFNSGSADFIVGFQSFANDQLIIFNRNSIHTVSNTVNLTSANVKQVTDEVGCLARRSIEQIGSEVLFLSDNGVYGISFVDEYNLRGTALPLSEPINKTIQRINKAHADKAVSAYFDNRYYLAVPLLNEDGSGTETITENNAVIIYNFLNKQWESVDTFGDDNTTFDILDLIVAGKGTNRAVYAINKQGGIHQLDVNEGGQDAIISTLGQDTATPVDVTSKARTRQFTLGDMDRKKWRDYEIHAESGSFNPSNFSISANTENNDVENIPLGTLANKTDNGQSLPKGEDIAIRGRIGNYRAYGIDIEIQSISGRPKLRAVEVNGDITSTSLTRGI